MCLGTLVLKNPLNPLAQFSLQQLSAAVQIYESLIKRHQSHAMAQNHDWLSRLLRRASAKITQAISGSGDAALRSATHSIHSNDEMADDVELLGWRTRLIEHAAQGTRRATTIHSGVSPGRPRQETFSHQHATTITVVQGAAPGGNLLAASADPPSVRSADSATDFLVRCEQAPCAEFASYINSGILWYFRMSERILRR
jgi:hypothetical protein